MRIFTVRILAVFFVALAACTPQQRGAPGAGAPAYDLVITNGLIYDGGGGAPFSGDIAIKGDRIAAIGNLDGASSTDVIDAGGMAVAPGFINMLSWAPVTLLEDGRGLSDIKQGVTLEVFGEGWSMGPWNDAMKAEAIARQADIKYDIEWTSLAEFLDHLEARGVSPNIASFVGATTIRIHELGEEDRPPNSEELEQMQALVGQAMEQGALGVGSSLIYAPAFYADTSELIALVDTAEDFGGSYITHMRSEGGRLLEAVDEVLEIAAATGASAEIYHLKAAGEENWAKLDTVIAKVNNARAAGVGIRANMYTYTAGATGLDAAMPPWVQEGGHDAWIARLKDPAIREKLLVEIETPTDEWENLYLAAGGADNVLFIGFKNHALKPLIGKTLADVAVSRGTSPAETMIDLVIEDDSRVDTVYFLMSDENVAKKAALPWMSFGSDEGAYAPEGVFMLSGAHPRAYGTFARVLGKYARDESLMPLAEAVRRLTSFPADNLKIRERGKLEEGYYADIVIFDPAAIKDHATYAEPHQLATGVAHVFVNGQQVLNEGEHTDAKPGRVVHGPGWTGWQGD